MGYSYALRCKNCGLGHAFLLGRGEKTWERFSRVISKMPPRKQKQVKEMLKKENAHATRYEKVIIHCTTCHRLTDQIAMEITYGPDREHVWKVDYNCPKCQTPGVEIAPEKCLELPCERCGENTLEHESSYQVNWA